MTLNNACVNLAIENIQSPVLTHSSKMEYQRMKEMFSKTVIKHEI